eukprot:gene25550-21593_t
MGKGDKEAAENVRVAIRARPLSHQEAMRGERDLLNMNIAQGSVTTPREHMDDPKVWAFNAVYNNSFTQRDVLSYFFERIHELQKLEPKKTFTLRLVFIEIYQDKVSDLLASDGDRKQIPHDGRPPL